MRGGRKGDKIPNNSFLMNFTFFSDFLWANFFSRPECGAGMANDTRDNVSMKCAINFSNEAPKWEFIDSFGGQWEGD